MHLRVLLRAIFISLLGVASLVVAPHRAGGQRAANAQTASGMAGRGDAANTSTERPTLAASNYALSPGDIVTIKVFREPDLDTQQRIAKEGTINFPLIGILKVTGMSSDQAAAKIAELLDKDYLVRPQVSVSVVTYSKQKFTILGQVASPGSYNIPDEQTLGLLNAIALAGGFTRLAKTSNVTVNRVTNGQAKTIRVDVDKLIKNGSADRILIQPNDVIVVEERFF